MKVFLSILHVCDPLHIPFALSVDRSFMISSFSEITGSPIEKLGEETTISSPLAMCNIWPMLPDQLLCDQIFFYSAVIKCRSKVVIDLKLGHKLIWLAYSLLTNELTQRHLITALDG